MNHDSDLTRLFGAYLNQDVFDLYEDEFEAAADFASDDPHGAEAAAKEIDRVLEGSADDLQIQAALHHVGLEIGPVNLSYREWLTKLADRLRAAT